jgi:hypothetical protein
MFSSPAHPWRCFLVVTAELQWSCPAMHIDKLLYYTIFHLCLHVKQKSIGYSNGGKIVHIFLLHILRCWRSVNSCCRQVHGTITCGTSLYRVFFLFFHKA